MHLQCLPQQPTFSIIRVRDHHMFSLSSLKFWCYLQVPFLSCWYSGTINYVHSLPGKCLLIPKSPLSLFTIHIQRLEDFITSSLSNLSFNTATRVKMQRESQQSFTSKFIGPQLPARYNLNLAQTTKYFVIQLLPTFQSHENSRHFSL